MIVATFVAALCIGHVTSYLVGDSCDLNPHVNGCSIPAHLPFFYKNVFKSDCNKHDVCYACGSAHGITRKECDQRLYNRIKVSCDTDPTVDSTTFCHSIAFTYYEGVRVGGGLFYSDTPKAYCGESWTSTCL